MSNPGENRFQFIQSHLRKHPTAKQKIDAKALEGEVIQNLRLLKATIQSEKVKEGFLDKTSHPSDSKSPVEQIQSKIIDELYHLNVEQLAEFVVPKRYFEECFELLVAAWRRRIQHSYPQTLTLEKIYFTKSSFRAFVIALSLNVSLKALRLKECCLAPYHMKLLAVFIKIHPTLTFLHLDYNPIKDDGLVSLVAALSSNEHVQHLSLINTQITDDGAITLYELLKKKRFKTLHLEKNKFTEKSIKLLQQIYDDSSDVLTIDEPIN